MTASAGKTGPAAVALVSSAGQAGRQIDSRELARDSRCSHSQRGERQALERRLESRAQHRVHNQIGVERSAVLSQSLGVRDNMDLSRVSDCSVRSTPLRRRLPVARALPATAWSPRVRHRPAAAPPSCHRRRCCRARTALSRAVHSGTAARAKAATAEEAARINWIDGIPNRSVVARSQACISAADRTCIATIVLEIGE